MRSENRMVVLGAGRLPLLMGVAAVMAACAITACSDDDDTSTATPDAGLNEQDANVPPGGDDDDDDDIDDVDSGKRDAGNADAGDEDAGPLGPDACRVTIDPKTAGFIELCTPSQGGTVKHVRLQGVQTSVMHTSAQVLFGSATQPTNPQAALEEDQFRVLLYAGSGFAPPPMITAGIGAKGITVDGNAQYIVSAPADVCFDLHDGAAGTGPAFALWVSGQKGANCGDPTTLTVASAFKLRATWGAASGAIDKAAKVYYRQAEGLATGPRVTLSSTAALTADAILGATECTTTWATNTDWQKLCTPAAGGLGHVRVEDVKTTGTNSYWYTILGQDPNPTGSPMAGDGKLIVTAGQSASSASWTYFRFNASGSTTQFTYATDTSTPLYVNATTTVCYDLGTTGTTGADQRIVFWATGAKGADCKDRATLTATSALYDSTTDASTGTIWTGLLNQTNKENFIKVNNANVTLTKVVVSGEPAAL